MSEGTATTKNITPEDTNNNNNYADNSINNDENDFSNDNIYQMDAQEMKKKVEELQQKNTALGLSVQRSRHIVRRLKLEYGVLLERLESRIKIDPELNYQNPLPTLETFKKELFNNPLKKPKSKKQRTRERDPNMPKRPTNAYLLYCEMNKDIIRQKGSFDVTKDLTEGWKSLSEEERAPYYQLYNEEKKRYHQEMEEYYRKLENSGLTNKPEGEEEGEEEDDDEREEEEEEDERTEGQKERTNKKEESLEDERTGEQIRKTDEKEETEGQSERTNKKEEDIEEKRREEDSTIEDVADIADNKVMNTTDNETSNSDSNSPMKEVTESVTAIQSDFKNIKKQTPDISDPMT